MAEITAKTPTPAPSPVATSVSAPAPKVTPRAGESQEEAEARAKAQATHQRRMEADAERAAKGIGLGAYQPTEPEVEAARKRILDKAAAELAKAEDMSQDAAKKTLEKFIAEPDAPEFAPLAEKSKSRIFDIAKRTGLYRDKLAGYQLISGEGITPQIVSKRAIKKLQGLSPGTEEYHDAMVSLRLIPKDRPYVDPAFYKKSVEALKPYTDPDTGMVNVEAALQDKRVFPAYIDTVLGAGTVASIQEWQAGEPERYRQALIDWFADNLGMSKKAAGETIADYIANPDDPQFKALPADSIQMLNIAAQVDDKTNLVVVGKDKSGRDLVMTTTQYADKQKFDKWIDTEAPADLRDAYRSGDMERYEELAAGYQRKYDEWASHFTPQQLEEILSGIWKIRDPETGDVLPVDKQTWKDYSDQVVAQDVLKKLGYMVDGGYDVVKIARAIRDGKLDQRTAEAAVGADVLAPVLAEVTAPWRGLGVVKTGEMPWQFNVQRVDWPDIPGVTDFFRGIKAQTSVGIDDNKLSIFGTEIPPATVSSLRQTANLVGILIPTPKYNILEEPIQFVGELPREVAKFVPGYATAEATLGSLIYEGQMRPWSEVATAAVIDTLFLLAIKGMAGKPAAARTGARAIDAAIDAVTKTPRKPFTTQLYDIAYGLSRDITSIPGTMRGIGTSVKLMPYEIRAATKSVIQNTVSKAQLAKYLARDAVNTMKARVPGVANNVWRQIELAVRRYLNSPSMSDRLAQAIINNARYTGYLARDIGLTIKSYLRANAPRMATSVVRQINRAYIAYMNSPTVSERVGKLLTNAYKRAGYEATGVAGKITAIARSVPTTTRSVYQRIDTAVIRYLNSPSLTARLDALIVDRAKFATYAGKNIAMTLKAEVPQLTTAMVNKVGREVTRYFISAKYLPDRMARAALSNAKLARYIIDDILATVKAALKTSFPKMTAKMWERIKVIVRRWLNSPDVEDRLLKAFQKRMEYTRYLAKEIRNGLRDGYRARELGTDIKTTVQAISQYMKDGNKNALRQAGEILEGMGRKSGNTSVSRIGRHISRNPQSYIDAAKRDLTPSEITRMGRIVEGGKDIVKRVTPQEAVMTELQRRTKPQTLDDLIAGRGGDQIASIAEKVIAEFKGIEATMDGLKQKLEGFNRLIRQINEGRISPKDIPEVKLDTRGMRAMLQEEGYPSFMIDNMLAGLPKTGGSASSLNLAQLRNYLESEANLIRRQMARLAARHAELTGDPAMAKLWGIEIAKGKPPARPEPLGGEPWTGGEPVKRGGVTTLERVATKPKTAPKPKVETTVTEVRVKPKVTEAKPAVKPEVKPQVKPKVETPAKGKPKTVTPTKPTTDIPVRAPVPGEGLPQKIVYPQIISFPSREGQQEFIKRLEETTVVRGKVAPLTEDETAALADRIAELSKRMTREQAVKQAVEDISRIVPTTTKAVSPAIATRIVPSMETRIVPAIRPVVGAKIAQEAATTPTTATKILTELKPALELKTPVVPAPAIKIPVKAPPITEAPPKIKKPPPPPPPIIFPGGSEGVKQAQITPGSIAYKKGLFWKWIPPEDFKDGVKPRTLPRGVSPIGADLSGGNSPYTTIQRIGKSDAVVPERISVDEGVTDAFITGGGTKIAYAGKGEDTNVGERIDSPTKGMSVRDGGAEPKGHAYARKVYPANSFSATDVSKEEPVRGVRKLRDGKNRVEITERTKRMLEGEEPEPKPATDKPEPENDFSDLVGFTEQDREDILELSDADMDDIFGTGKRKRKPVNRLGHKRTQPRRGRDNPPTILRGIRL